MSRHHAVVLGVVLALTCSFVHAAETPVAAAPGAGTTGRVVLDVQPHWRVRDGERGRARHVAMPMPLDARVTDVATRHAQPDGAVLWRLHLESPGAVFMSVKFSRFVLPAGVTLRFVARDAVYAAGPFTDGHVKTTGRFGSPMIPGDTLTIEMLVPAGSAAPDVVIESVSHGYRDAMGMRRFFETDADDPVAATGGGPFGCQRDIVCPEGAPYLHLKDAVAEGYDGSYVCSGQLINNVRQDGRYLYITAEHCGWWQDPSTVAFYWDYANETCGGDDFPAYTYSTGATDLYHSTNSDFDVNLLELDGTDLEGEYDVYYAGWNRGLTAPTSTVIVSHPDDKPLQIAVDTDPAIDCVTGSCPNGWGPPYWRINDYEIGMPEGGSSGGGLFDQDLLLVGVLTGGVGTDCNDFGWDEYFKLSGEWAALRPYLDPDDTGAMTTPGWDGSSVPCAADVNGDGFVNVDDLVMVIVAWGTADPEADINDDGFVDVNDVVGVITNWGPC